MAVLILVSGCKNSSTGSDTSGKQDTTQANSLLPESEEESGYTFIKKKEIHVSKKNYEYCYSATWGLKIPLLIDFPEKDIRLAVNDSINKLVNRIFGDTLNFESNSGKISDCGI